MKLADLQLDNIRLDVRQAGIDITGISADSRKVKPGFLFFAIAGTKADGGHFAKQAAAAGAVAVAAEGRPNDLPASPGRSGARLVIRPPALALSAWCRRVAKNTARSLRQIRSSCIARSMNWRARASRTLR